MTCPDELELARAQSEGADDALEAHLAGCADCRAAWEATARAIALARELPVELPSAAHREELRTALLAMPFAPAPTDVAAPPSPPEVTPRRARPHAMYGLAAFAAVAAGATFYLVERPTAHEVAIVARGSVHAHAGARYELAAASPDERVRLHDGTIDVDVAPLAPGERFRVVIGAAEVEVHGTAFEVTAKADELVGVRVVRGRVEVRPAGHPAAVLGPGQSWHTDPPVIQTPTPPPPVPHTREADTVAAIAAHDNVTDAAIAPHPSHDVPHEAVTEVAPPPARPTEELAYDDAWDALRAGKFHQSSAAFARALALAPDGPLSDDARYWHAVSLARERRVADAISAFRELLDEHAGGAHRGEASVMLGWLLVDTHERAEAEARFHAAETDASPEVQRSARAGLAAIVH